MISNGLEWVADVCKDALPIVNHNAGFSVHYLACKRGGVEEGAAGGGKTHTAERSLGLKLSIACTATQPTRIIRLTCMRDCASVHFIHALQP